MRVLVKIIGEQGQASLTLKPPPTPSAPSRQELTYESRISATIAESGLL
jgi:hypothetical protein